MLLRNIDQYAGMCNDTFFIVTRMKSYLLEANLIYGSSDIYGSNVGQKDIIPRLSLTSTDKKISFKFQ
jgi:hypothetical protein